MVLVPLVLGVVYLIVHSWLCKMELKKSFGYQSGNLQRSEGFTSLGEIRTTSPGHDQHWNKKAMWRSYHISDGVPRAGRID